MSHGVVAFAGMFFVCAFAVLAIASVAPAQPTPGSRPTSLGARPGESAPLSSDGGGGFPCEIARRARAHSEPQATAARVRELLYWIAL